MKKTSIALLVCSLLLLTGCSKRLGDFTVLSTNNTSLGDSFIRVAQNSKGVHSKPILLIIPLGAPNIEDAVSAALDKYQGEILTDVVVYLDWYYIPLIFGERKYRVIGDVWIRKDSLSQDAQMDAQNAKDIYVYDKDETGAISWKRIEKDDPAIKQIN